MVNRLKKSKFWQSNTKFWLPKNTDFMRGAIFTPFGLFNFGFLHCIRILFILKNKSIRKEEKEVNFWPMIASQPTVSVPILLFGPPLTPSNWGKDSLTRRFLTGWCWGHLDPERRNGSKLTRNWRRRWWPTTMILNSWMLLQQLWSVLLLLCDWIISFYYILLYYYNYIMYILTEIELSQLSACRNTI